MDLGSEVALKSWRDEGGGECKPTCRDAILGGCDDSLRKM